MKNLEIMGVQEMDAMELKDENGGLMLIKFNWGMFWDGMKIGVPVGAGAAGVYMMTA